MRRSTLALFVLLSACRWDGTWSEPTPGLQRMIDQPRVDAYARSTFFEDGMAMRRPPEGTVPWRSLQEDAPPALDAALLARGRDRFDVFCAPCHGLDGEARTPIAEDMALRAPPALFEPRVVTATDAHLHRVIVEGWGLMPSYAVRLAPRDRWAVVAYVRAVQLGAATPAAWLSAADRRALEESGS